MQESVIQRINEILRTKCKDNISNMSREIGIHQTTLNNYFLKKRKPSLEFVEAILHSYEDISAEWLLRGTGTMSNGIEDVEKPIMNNDQIMSLVESINTMSAQVKSLREENLMLKSQAQNRKKA